MMLFLWMIVGLLFGLSVPTFSLKIISRNDWGARPETSHTQLKTPVKLAIIHHTATSTCNDQKSCSILMRSMQNYQMDSEGSPDIGYNFVIGGDGKVYEGRGWTKAGAHAVGCNLVSEGIALMGNFDKDVPNKTMKNALTELLADGVAKKYLTRDYKIDGHGDVNPTECPGKRLFDYIKNLPQFKKQPPECGTAKG